MFYYFSRFLFILLLILTLSTADGFASGTYPIKRILFKQGEFGASVKGTVQGDECKDYIFRAKKGQIANMHLTSSNNHAVFRIISINGVPDEKLMLNIDLEFSKELPESGDYTARVCMTRVARRKKGAISHFNLDISIR